MVGAGAAGAPAGRREIVGAGAAGAAGAPAGRRAMVGAGAAGAVETPVGIGGLVATGAAGGASDALRVTRTVSFFKGIEEVCLLAGKDGAGAGLGEEGAGISFSLMLV